MSEEKEDVPARKIDGEVKVEPGCLGYFALLLIAAALMGIVSKLGDIHRDLVFMSCWQQATDGVLCEAAKKEKSQ